MLKKDFLHTRATQTLNRDKENELKYMFEVSTVPKIVLIHNDQYHVFHKSSIKGLEDFTEFINGGYLRVRAVPLPEKKTTLEKFWFLNKSAIDLAISYLDTFGLSWVSYEIKVGIVLLAFMLPFIFALLWVLMPQMGPKISPQRKKEIFRVMREKIRKRRQVHEEPENDQEDEEMGILNAADIDRTKSS